MRSFLVAATALVALLVAGCDPGDTGDTGDTDPGDTDPGDTDPGDTDPGDPPATPALIASAATIVLGDSVDLVGWFAGGDGLLEPDVGAVLSGVPVSVTPAATTEYTLTVTNDAGTETAATTVTVVEGASLTVTLAGALPTTPVVWAFGPDGSVEAFAASATQGDLLPGTWHVAAPNVPEAAALHVVSVDAPSVTLAPGGAATVTVSYALSDTPPTVDPIPVTPLGRDATTVIPFTVGDFEEPAAGLAVAVTAEGPLGLDLDALVLGGSGAERTLTVTTPDATGHAEITLTVKDGRGNTAATSFVAGIGALVTSTDDAGPGTLRAANEAGATVIDFSPSLGAPIVLSSGVLVVDRLVWVLGSKSSPVSVSGGGTQGIFVVQDGGELHLSGLVLSHADRAVRVEFGSVLRVADSAFVDNTASSGAAILNRGEVEVERTLFARNVSDCGAGCGGSGGAVLVVQGSIGPDVRVAFQARDSTFSGNVARATGGAAGSAIGADGGYVLLERCTVTDNACEGPNCYGGAVHLSLSQVGDVWAALDVRGSVIAGNTGGVFADLRAVGLGRVGSGGYNVLGVVTAFALGDDDLSEVDDPLLTPLGDHGGPFDSHVPLPGSPALGRLPWHALDGRTIDVRGAPRRAGGVLNSDSGAVERQASDPTAR